MITVAAALPYPPELFTYTGTVFWRWLTAIPSSSYSQGTIQAGTDHMLAHLPCLRRHLLIKATPCDRDNPHIAWLDAPPIRPPEDFLLLYQPCLLLV